MSAEADRALGKAQGGNNSQGPIYRVPVSPGSPPCCLLCQALISMAATSAAAMLASCSKMCFICMAAGQSLFLESATALHTVGTCPVRAAAVV